MMSYGRRNDEVVDLGMILALRHVASLMLPKGNSAPDDDGVLLQLVSDSAPYFYDPNREIEFTFTPPVVATPVVMERSTVANTSYARKWRAARINSDAWSVGLSAFDEAVQNLLRANPFDYHLVRDTSLCKPEPELDLDSHLGLHTDADKLFFEECDELWGILDGEAGLSCWDRPRVKLPALKLGGLDQSAGARITGVTIHDYSKATMVRFGHPIRRFEAFDSESGVIRTGFYGYDDDELVQLNSFGAAYEDSLEFGVRDWARVEVNDDGSVVLLRRKKGLANHYALTVPAASCITTTVASFVLSEKADQPWVLEARRSRSATSSSSALLHVAPHGEDTSNHPLESHDRDSWSLCAAPARSRIEPVRIAA